MHLLDGLTRYELQLQADGRSPHTLGQYRRHVRLLATRLAQDGHSGQVEDIDDGDIAGFLASDTVRLTARGTPRSPGSGNALRTSIRQIFVYLHGAGLIPTNPARLVRRAMTAPPPPRAIRPAEQERLLDVLRSAEGFEARRDLVLVELMLASGVRLSSALALDVDDLDLDEGVLRLRGAKGGRELQAYIPRPACEALRGHLDGRVSGPVFAGKTGTRITARHVQRRFRTWREAAELPTSVTPHSLRHGFAMRLYSKTGDILLVGKALGHASITSTLAYVRADEARVRAAVM